MKALNPSSRKEREKMRAELRSICSGLARTSVWISPSNMKPAMEAVSMFVGEHTATVTLHAKRGLHTDIGYSIAICAGDADKTFKPGWPQYQHSKCFAHWKATVHAADWDNLKYWLSRCLTELSEGTCFAGSAVETAV